MLGVHKTNSGAIKLYKKLGFKIIDSNRDGISHVMRLTYNKR